MASGDIYQLAHNKQIHPTRNRVLAGDLIVRNHLNIINRSRVGNLPKAIKSYYEYQTILNSFEKIPFDEKAYLESESSV